ncbi:MAG TPA: hypothetical protein VML54_09550, partial [Candidatus Limnocylindrales bacterium]|nr:hypothetical protein [Candidatus Limnocylindrales bacterium]
MPGGARTARRPPRRSSEDDLILLIDAIYGAATEPERWADVLGLIRDHLGLLGCNLISMDSSLRDGLVVAHAGLDPTAVAEWSDWVDEDVAAAALRRQPLGSVVNAVDCVPGAVYEKTDFYNGLMRRYGLYHLAGTNLLEAEGRLVTFGMHRGKRDPFDAEIWRRFAVLLPHLRRAATLQVRLGEAEERRRELAETLDTLRVGAVLLGPRGEVRAANRAAERMAASGDGFAIAPSGLRGATP